MMLARLNTEERCMTKEEFLYELQKETLNILRPYLCCHLEPIKVLAWLQSKNFFSVDDCEQIQNMSTTKAKVNKLIDILIKSGPDGLIQLCKAINYCNKTQKFIAVKLNNTYKEIKHRTENQEKLNQIVNGLEPHRNNPDQHNCLPPPYSPPRSLSPSPKMHPPSFQFSQKPAFQFPDISDDSPSKSINPDLTSAERPRIPVINEWPHQRSLSDTGSNYFSSEQGDASSFHSSDFNGRCDSTLTVFESPSYIDHQVEKLNNTIHKSCPPPTEDAMTSVIEEQDNQFEKYQRNALKLFNNRPDRRSRSPNEHDTARSFQRSASPTPLKEVASSSSGVYSANSDPETLLVQPSLQVNCHERNLNPVTTTSPPNYESITIFRPDNNESFEVSGGCLTFQSTS